MIDNVTLIKKVVDAEYFNHKLVLELEEFIRLREIFNVKFSDLFPNLTDTDLRG